MFKDCQVLQYLHTRVGPFSRVVCHRSYFAAYPMFAAYMYVLIQTIETLLPLPGTKADCSISSTLQRRLPVAIYCTTVQSCDSLFFSFQPCCSVFCSEPIWAVDNPRQSREGKETQDSDFGITLNLTTNCEGSNANTPDIHYCTALLFISFTQQTWSTQDFQVWRILASLHLL